MRVIAGQRFDTMYENACLATSDSDDDGNFDGIDSDGSECTFNTIMVIDVYDNEEATS
jgi:hypothetical protein